MDPAVTQTAPDGKTSTWQRWRIVIAIIVPLVTTLWGAYTMLGLSIDRHCQEACAPHTASVGTRLSCWCIDEMNCAWSLSQIKEGVECLPEHAHLDNQVCYPEYWQGVPAAPYGETPHERRVRKLQERLRLEAEDRLWGIEDP